MAPLRLRVPCVSVPVLPGLQPRLPHRQHVVHELRLVGGAGDRGKYTDEIILILQDDT